MKDTPRAIGQDDIAMAIKVASWLGGNYKPFHFFHDELDLTTDILHFPDTPTVGATSYVTVGLSDTPLTWGDGEFPTRLELVGASYSENKPFSDVLGTAAVTIMRSKKPCVPGSVIPNCVAEYFSESHLPHLYLSSPFSWEDGTFQELILPSKTVNWLQAFPISQAEYEYRKEFGDDRLEDLFESNEIDIFDMKRPSVV